MTLDITKPETASLIQQHLESGRFHDLDELLMRALGALKEPAASRETALRYDTSALDWSQCPAVESVPGKVSGAWVFKDTRMPVAAVFENLEDGITIDELVEIYPGLTRDQIAAVLDFAARSLHAPPHAG